MRGLANHEETDEFSKLVHQNDGRDQNDKVLRFQSSASDSFNSMNKIKNKFIQYQNLTGENSRKTVIFFQHVLRIFKIIRARALKF